MGSFINILKAPPAAHVVDKNRLVLRSATRDIMKEPTEFLSMFDRDTTLPGVGIGRYDDIAMALRVCLNRSLLIGYGILLVLCGHAYILRCGNWGLCLHETSKTKIGIS